MFRLSVFMKPITSFFLYKHLILQTVLLPPLLGILAFPEPLTETLLPSGGSPGSSDDLWDEDPSDNDMWLAISSSMALWEKMKKHRLHKRSDEEVCYEGLGCFRDEGIFDYLDTLPDSPEYIDTKFILFTNNGPADGELLSYDNSNTLWNSHFNNKQPVKIIIHGFGGNSGSFWTIEMRMAFLDTEDMNVILVDWKKGAAMPNLLKAAANTHLVGKQIAALISMINNEMGLTNADYHIIGFSLGAHVAGFAGEECPNISRITGLDPAGIMFEGYKPSLKLDPSDATFVDVIHSNGESVLRGGCGAFEPLGHVDFYPNGGREQIGCRNIILSAITDVISGTWQSLCNHRRAVRFFIDSISPDCKFLAFPCDSYENFLAGKCFQCNEQGCPNMGYYVDKSEHVRGKYFLSTRETKPFCANQYLVDVSNSRGQEITWGTLEISFVAENTSNETFVILDENQEIRDNEDIHSLIVADSSIRNITAAVLKYSKRDGWFYSALDRWYIDKIEIVNGDGKRLNYCGPTIPVKHDEPANIPLSPEDCSALTTNFQIHDLIWDMAHRLVKRRSV